jgi:hypothetical protein
LSLVINKLMLKDKVYKYEVLSKIIIQKQFWNLEYRKHVSLALIAALLPIMKSDADWLATEINKTSYKETSVTDGHLIFLKNMNDVVVPIFCLYRIIQQTFPNALGLYLKFGL